MGSPFTVTSVSNYNSNPPPDDGSQVASNRVQWATQKTKLSDPIFNAFNSSETETSAAFGKVVGGAGLTTTGVNYTVSASDQGKIVKASASGITITTPDATVVGSPFVFSILNNSTGDITVAGNGTQTVDGDLTFSLPAGCGLMLNTDGSNWFSDGRNFNNVLQQPQGYLTPTSATPIIPSDVTSATSVYFTPFVGDRVPISTDGATFKMRQFSELTLTLNSNHVANGIYDVFLFDNSGVTTIGTGPEWTVVTAGSCARGSGAGTTEINRAIHGLFTNKNSMTARNGATTYTVAANEGLYVGTLWIDGTAGQVTCHRSWGQSRKWGIWNAFNRQPIVLQAGDSTSSWNFGNTTPIRPSNGNTANSLTTLAGLAEEIANLSFLQKVLSNNSAQGSWEIGIGYNSTSQFSGTTGFLDTPATILTGSTINGLYDAMPSLGINTVTSLELAPAGISGTFSGTVTNMNLRAVWKG